MIESKIRKVGNSAVSWMKTATCFRHLHDPMGLDAAARIACHP